MTTENMLNDPFSSYKAMSSVRHVCLPPRYLGNVAQGIRDQLDSEINLYCTDLESVVISYENLKLLQAVGSILDDSPFLHFKIQADYVVFKPTIGCILKGIVNKVSKDHVGCLVHDRFNASIHRPRQSVNGWRGSQLQQGEQFPFEVLDIYANNAVISLKGKLVDQSIIETYLRSLKPGKSKSENSVDGDFVDSGEGEITLGSDPVITKKRKRTTSSGGDGVEKLNASNDLANLKTAKKKKKRSHKNEESDIETMTTSAVESIAETGTPMVSLKRKHGLKTDNESISKETSGIPSAKKVRFDTSFLKSSPESNKKAKKIVEISPISQGYDRVDDHDGSYLESSVIDESFSQVRELKKKKKKKHKKSDIDVIEKDTTEDSSWTKLKETSNPGNKDNDVKKKRKKKKKADADDSNSESSDAQSLVLGTLADGFGKIFSELQSSQKNKKLENQNKDLIGVMKALQSEVAKVTTKLMTPGSSSKKKKQKKKKNRDSSSLEQDSDSGSRSISRRTFENSVLGDKESSDGDVDMGGNRSESEKINDSGFRKKRSSGGYSVPDGTKKKKNKKKLKKDKHDK